MRITFIRPNIGRMAEGRYIDEGRMEPLELAVLAALIPPDIDCRLYDDRMEDIPYDEPTDLVALTVEIYTARRSYEISAEYKKRGVPVIMGGFHPTLIPEEVSAHADSVFIGDAETHLASVIEDLRKGKLKARYEATPSTPQPNRLMPRRDLLEGKGYLPISLIQFGRGCRFACDYCAISVFFDRKQHVRPFQDVIDEIKSQGRKFVFFVDDNFISDHVAAKAFLKELIPLKVKWISQGSIDMTDDPELMDLIEASGCIGMVIGFESLNQENVRNMRKAPNLTRKYQEWDRYDSQVEILRKHHLQTWAAFTLGHDHDTIESIRDVGQFAHESKFAFAAYNILMPYPGTPLYDRLKNENRLLWDGKWWLHPDYKFNHASFVPKNMTADELTEVCWQLRDEWNSFGSIFKRMWDFKTHMSSPFRLASYLAYNRIYSKEAYKKQGMLFGETENVFSGEETSNRGNALLNS